MTSKEEMIAVKILSALGIKRASNEWDLGLDFIKGTLREAYPHGAREDHHGPKQDGYMSRAIRKQ